MKINVITSPFGELPPNAVGAVEKLFYQIAVAWAYVGHSVCFVCAGGGSDERLGYVRLGRKKRTGRTLTDLPIDLWYSLRALFAMPQCDVLVCNTFWAPILAPIFRLKYKKLIYGVHRFPKGQLGLYRCVDSFICVSTAIADAVKKQCPRLSPRVDVVCNPIDTKIFRSLGDYVRRGSKLTVVYTGRVAVEKGVLNLARAVSKLSEEYADVRLVLAGPWESAMGGGGEEYLAVIRAAFPLAEVLGPIYDACRMAELIRSADIYCYPTIAERGEAFGIAPLEAMACGAPVVLPRFACFFDYAKDRVNCLMYDTPEMLYEALARVARDNAFAESIAKTAAQSVSQFAIETIAAKYLAVFERLLNGNVT